MMTHVVETVGDPLLANLMKNKRRTEKNITILCRMQLVGIRNTEICA